jgi:hypothetical protein
MLDYNIATIVNTKQKIGCLSKSILRKYKLTEVFQDLTLNIIQM